MDMFPPTLDEILAELEREVVVRKRVFPRWVDNGQLKQELADRRIQLMEAAAALIARMEDPCPTKS